MIGLITGSGFYDLPNVVDRQLVRVRTEHGDVDVTKGVLGDVSVGFLARHGSDHSIPPQAINYRANVAALKKVGAEAVLATAVSGAIDPSLPPGQFVAISDFIDFTTGRPDTFFDGSDGTVTHTDMSEPYSAALRALIIEAAKAEGISVVDGGVYCCANGPRFETRAEIAMMGRAGGTLVGMTGYPEVALANELGMAYASIGVVSNPAAGLGLERLSADDIFAIVEDCSGPLHRLIAAVVAGWKPES